MTERERFDNILRETGRRGIENVLFELDKLGFYSAPASTRFRFHGSYPGGLLKHSLNVYDEAMMVLELQLRQRSGIEHLIPVCSIAIAALLHDVCKAEVYRPEIKKRKNALGVWESYDGYGVDYSNFPLGHGEKSVISPTFHVREQNPSGCWGFARRSSLHGISRRYPRRFAANHPVTRRYAAQKVRRRGERGKSG